MAAHAVNEASIRGRRAAVSGGDPILTSKITPPNVPDWAVPRPRITQQIAEGTRWCPLTVVTGPPGAGKTMALALWAAAEPGPVAWVGLDDFDNRPGMFWSYVVAALRQSPRPSTLVGRVQARLYAPDPGVSPRRLPSAVGRSRSFLPGLRGARASVSAVGVVGVSPHR